MELVKGLLDRPITEEEKDEKITLALNGQQYEDFISASVVKDLTEIAGGFAFKLTDRTSEGIPFGADDEVEVFIDGEKVINGFTMTENDDSDIETSIIDITGKDRTIDFVQSELSTNITFGDSNNSLEELYLNDLKKQPVLTGDFSLVDVIRKALLNINLNIDVNIQEGVQIDNFTQEENIIGKAGDKAFKFCEKYARKRNVVITTDRDSNILIQRTTKNYNGEVLQYILGNETNNVEKSSISKNHNNKFFKYTARCSQNLSLGVFGENPTNKTVTIFNDQVRQSRQRDIVMDSNSTSTLRKRLIWQKNFDLNTDEYKCTVKGFRSNVGSLWYPNMLVEVNDERRNIKKRMLIKRAEWKFSEDGTFTNMILVDPIAFSDVEDYEYNFNTNEIKR